MSWETDLEAAWAEIDETNRDDFVERIRSAVNDPSVPPEIRDFEIACAHDSTGRSDLAVDGYRQALSAGLAGYRGRRANIQLASSLRNLGQSDESVRILSEESTSADDGLDDAVTVFLALSLVDVDRDREAVAHLVHALADHLPRYTASAHRYADRLITPADETAGASATEETHTSEGG